MRRPSGLAVSATTRACVPPFLMVKANDIEEWANTHESRDLLAVLLRTLVHSTCGGLELVDFPGNDDAQRHGWDGRVKTSEGNPWVPKGISRWEFGTNREAARKANDDYAKRTESTVEAKRRRRAFVFVTPRRWKGKERWLREKRAEAKWREVRALDASDLEQWLEQSIPGQVWFRSRLGLSTQGVKSLDRCWVEWCANCKPRFSEDIFAEAMSIFGEKVRGHLQDENHDLLRIVTDSRQEGLAFLAALLSQQDKDLCGIKDKVLTFTEPGPLSKLAVGSPSFIPVVANPEVEKELAQSGCALKGFVVEFRTAAQHEPDVTLDPLSHQAFREALGSMGLGADKIARLDRESGRSLTVLRQRLTKSKAIRSPNWSSDEKLAGTLVPIMLAGAWRANNNADKYLMVELAGCENCEQLEKHFIRLLNLKDSPVWSIDDFRGVVSQFDALYGVHAWMRDGQIDRFFEVAELVLSERDPALDLAKDEQWTAPLYGKDREISSPLRKGIAESLVLLAIHGDRFFGQRIGLDPARKVADLVRRLLEPMTADKLLSQSSNLPLYAEAAPATFLEIFEREMSRSKPKVAALMKPTGNILLQRSERVDLLWALELLAWRPEWLDRVVALLAALAELEPDDNLENKPSESLQGIFRSWMPQTAAPLKHRIAVFDRLVKQHPTIGWRIATTQFEPGPKTSICSHKPIWRDYALGFGKPLTNRDPHAFVVHCVKTCLDWRSHSRETLADLMRSAERLVSSHLARLGDAVADWAADAKDEDRAWLRERIRGSMQRNIHRKSGGKPVPATAQEGVLMARRAFETLEPRDPVWKHAWLFENPHVKESWDELEEDVEVRAERIRALRLDAVREVTAAAGHAGILRLAFSGNAPQVAGASAAKAIEDEDTRLAFVRAVLDDGDVPTSEPHQSLVSGFLHELGGAPATRLVGALWPECGEDVGVKLLCLCGFERLVWSKVRAMGKTVADEYWAKVQPSWQRHKDEDINYAIARLLAAGRPRAALDYAPFDWGRVECGHIHGILADFPGSDEVSHRSVQLDPYRIRKAFEVLNERNALSRDELARLEFLYLDLDLFWLEKGDVPNLEKEIEANPELFSELVALVYPRENDDKLEPTEGKRNLARKASELLYKLARIPGYDNDGALQAGKLKDWICRVQELCDANGRRARGDYRIGELLSNAPRGEDGVWPCTPVREALEAVLNDSIRKGFQIGRHNSRGMHWRGEGGRQERELARQYEEWAKASNYSYPKVARMLRELASSYRSEERWQDQKAAVERRLDHLG